MIPVADRVDRMTNVRPEMPLVTWRDCPTCWAQGQIVQGDDVLICWSCLGVGQVAR